MGHSRIVGFALATFALAASPTVAARAQGGVLPPPARRQAVRQAIKAQRQAERADSGKPVPNERAELQRQVRQAWQGVVRRQLNLNQEQMRSLNQVNGKYERERNSIVRDERQARLALKAAMADSGATDQNARVEQQLNVLVQAQRRRADLFENEQKDLSGFLTPLQRAKFSALQEQLNKRLQNVVQSTAPVGPPPPDTP